MTRLLILGVLGVLTLLAGCASISPASRWQYAEQLAQQAGWQKLRIPTEKFVLSAYLKQPQAQADTLTIYIEGDGLAWLTPSQASSDPTPRNPVGLQLALRHPQHLQAQGNAAAYLARPCQYVAAEDARNCRQAYWTDRRFSAEVIEASDQAISVLKQRIGAGKLVLVGYSGGGAVAALVAARRNDVLQLITVAGNLDHRAWTAQHQVPPLEGSLNPADAWRALVNLPQRHFVGARDEVVSRAVVEAYAVRFPVQQRPKIIVMPDFDHVCCWVERWSEISLGSAHTFSEK